MLQLLATYDLTSGGVLDRAEARFLDLGTGNGHMLMALRENEDDYGERWRGEMWGVDYSPTSVRLARRIYEGRRKEDEGEDDDDDDDDDEKEEEEEEDEEDEEEEEEENDEEKEESEYAKVKFVQWDLLTEQADEKWLKDGFDVVLDKGTFDAISLMPAASATTTEAGAVHHPCETYRERVVELIKPGNFLFVTSCNWTKEELISWLVTENSGLRYHDEAKYPTFKFGGKTGQSVVTVVFKRDDLWTGIVRSDTAAVDSTASGTE